MNNFFFITFCFILNIFYFHFGLVPNGLSWDCIYKIDGDSFGYIESVENLIIGKGFTFFKTNEDLNFISNFYDANQYDLGIFYAFRSPGFAFFYLPLRIFLSQHYALICFLLLQIVFTAIAKFYVAKISEFITNSKRVFLFTLLLINSTPYFVQYNNLILTESLGFSFLVFGVYYFIKNFQTDLTSKYSKYYLFFSGLFLTIALMLRPFLVVFLFSCGFFIIYKYWANKKSILKYALVFSIPFLIINGTWTIRNYIKTSKFIPLAYTLRFQDHKHLAFFEIKKISSELGYSNGWFEKSSPVYWYVNSGDKRRASEIFFKQKTLDFFYLDKLKKEFHASLDKTLSIKDRRKLELINARNLKELNIKSNTFITNKISVFKEFIHQNNNNYFHSIKYPFNVLVVFTQSLVLKLFLIIGVLLSILYLILNPLKINIEKILYITSMYLVFYFCFIIRIMEPRELYTYSFIFLIIPFKFYYDHQKNKYINVIFFFGLIYVVFLAIHQTSLEIKW